MKSALSVALLLLALIVEASPHGGCSTFRGPGGEVPPGYSSDFGAARWGIWWRRHANGLLARPGNGETHAWSSAVPGADPTRIAAVLRTALDAVEGGRARARILVALSSPGLAAQTRALGITARFREILADGSEPEITRIAAAVSIGRTRHVSPENVHALHLALVSDERVAIRASAAVSLGLLNASRRDPLDPGIAGALERAANDPSENVASAALLGLGLTRDARLLPGLLWTLRADVPDGLRAATILAIGHLLAAHPALLDHEVIRTLLAAGEESASRRALAIVLGHPVFRADAPSVVPSILALASGPRDRTAEAALVSLGRLGAVLTNGRARIRLFLEANLVEGRIRRRPFAALGLGLLGRDADVSVAERVEIRGTLLATLAAPSSRANDRGACAVALGLVGGPGVETMLLPHLSGRVDPAFRAACALGIGLTGETTDAAAILAGVEQDGSEDLRLRSARATALLGIAHGRAPDGEAGLLGASRLRALGRVGDPAAVEALLEHVRRPGRVDVAAVALADLLDGSPRSVLSDLAEDVGEQPAEGRAVGRLLDLF